MKTQTEEIEAAVRRGQRIAAMKAGKPIPFPESAVADARPGNSDDEIVSALVRGRATIPGASIFPPARILATNFAANEAQEMLAIGATVSGYSIGESYHSR